MLVYNKNITKYKDFYNFKLKRLTNDFTKTILLINLFLRGGWIGGRQKNWNEMSVSNNKLLQ